MFFGTNSFSQKLDSVQQLDVLKRIDLLKLTYDYEKIIDSCDKYLVDEKCGWFRDQLFVFKTQSIFMLKRSQYFFEKRFGLDLGSYCKIADSVTGVIDSLIVDECQLCNRKILFYNRMRYEYFGGYDIILSELNTGKNKVYKKEEFLAISPQIIFGNNQWIGFEVFGGVFQRRSRMKYIPSNSMFSYEMFRLGFRKNISYQKGYGFNISYLSGSYKWINIQPINFLFLDNGENKSWGYAPEVGFQFWYLHLNAGYNLAFKKSMRNYEKLYFTAKFDIPIHRF